MGAVQGVPPTNLLDGAVVSYHPRLGAVVGVVGALILQQVHYWSRNGGKEVDGVRWMKMTTREWVQSLGGVSRTKIVETLTALRDRGVLYSSATMNKSRSDRTNWYRINYAKLDTICRNPAHPFAGNGQIHLPESVHSKDKDTKEDTEEETGEAFASQGNTGDTMKVEDLLPKGKKGGEFAAPQNVNATNLAMYWRRVLSMEHDVQFMRPPTAREKGQFAHLIKAVGPSNAVVVISTSVRRWGEVVAYLKDYAGVPSMAVQPNVAQILKYCEHIMNFLNKSATIVKVEIPPNTTKTIVHPVPQIVKDTPATPEELAELEKKFGLG